MAMLDEHLRRRLSTRAPKRASAAGLMRAAVLIPLLEGSGGYRLVLTRRASSLRRQPGDISFPGGAIDATDTSPLAAALRESDEEVGLKPSDVSILGQLDERVTVTGFVITPFVGVVRELRGSYPFRTNHEVEELLLVPLTSLVEPGVLHVERWEIPSGVRIPVYHYHYGEHDIWGITGQLVRDLLELLPERL